VIFFLIILAVFLYIQNNKLDITEYEIESEKAGKEFRIVHLSDFHSKPFDKVLYSVKSLSPDIICITGDFINDRGKRKEKMLDFAKNLTGIASVYYVTGNHERRLDCFENLMDELRRAGFTVLLNECVQTDFGAILGLDENQADFDDYKARRKGTFEYQDMSPYFAELDRYDGFKIVLSHYPENFEALEQMNYSQYKFDLQLSGHAHGGQWIMPLIGPLFSPGQGVFPKYARGSFGEKPRLIVSRGLGNSEFPFRLFNHPEIIVIDVKNKL
jgi:hypothetical protein